MRIAGETDFLDSKDRGRYLYCPRAAHRRRHGHAILRRIRLDFPRLTSLDLLPLVYREEPEAKSSPSEFLSIFDASVRKVVRSYSSSHIAILAPFSSVNQRLAYRSA
jgi:hypothetical protein